MKMKKLFTGLVSLALALPIYAQTAQSYQAPTLLFLPNNPLYKLELTWDRISLAFTTNPYAKAQKLLPMADRELTGAQAVIASGDFESGLHSAFRGENYMTMFVNELKAAAYDTGSLQTDSIVRAHSAYIYHQQLINEMIAKTSGDVQNQLKQILEFSQRNDNELKLLEEEYQVTKQKSP